ncbi:MAG: hypothetical protein HGA73_04195, partial [Syntrophaceae bacterium]|nr:hypothetical protein [Syntrophaceae bacterium]
MRRIIVFLGPSLERATAETILAAEYRPPAKRGDLLWAVQDGAEVIGLIDGVFHQESAVAHREILTAIKKGVRVVGASSMGALRAAEMDTLGMTGIGEVYQMYRSGDLISDDERLAARAIAAAVDDDGPALRVERGILPTLRVDPYGVSRKRLEQAVKELQLPVIVARLV